MGKRETKIYSEYKKKVYGGGKGWVCIAVDVRLNGQIMGVVSPLSYLAGVVFNEFTGK